jgi:hypothetical protein
METDIYGAPERNSVEFFFVNQFSFAWQLKNYFINSRPGVIISFIGIIPQNEIVRFYYEDIKTLEDINKISEYKVKPISN